MECHSAIVPGAAGRFLMSKILVIEDSAEVRDRIVTSLGFEGFDIIEAEDGEAGVQLAKETKPDLIICDVMMPKLDGHATLTALRENRATAAIPFIFLSAKSQVSDMREGLQLGADDYLIKPFSIVDLTDAVNLRLRRREELAAAIPEGGQAAKIRAQPNFEEELRKALETGSADRVRVAVFVLQVIGPERIRRALGGASVAPVMNEAEDRLSRLGDCEFGPLDYLGDGKFRAVLVGNRLPMAADDIFAPLFACLSEPFERDGAVVNLSAAIGVALFPTHGASAKDLLRRAEAALDAAMEKRENGYRFYTSDLESRAAERHDRTASLFRAFQASDFEMRYRLEVECRTERPARILCVPTWRHPERGMVPLFDYEPLIGEAGLIDTVFDWAVAEVCRQKAAWEDSAWEKLPLAIHIATPQLFGARLAPRLAHALQQWELDGQQFELHFSQELLLNHPGELAPMLEVLKTHGFQITVDGFAVGAHLLDEWHSLPLNNLSLEGGILNRALDSNEDRLMLTALISLAHGIGLKVNASGIESEDLFDLLRLLQCDGIRRYRSKAPLAPKKLESLLRRRRLF